MTNSEIADSWSLWCLYVDPGATMTQEEFDAMTTADRLQIIADCFGEQEDELPNVPNGCEPCGMLGWLSMPDHAAMYDDSVCYRGEYCVGPDVDVSGQCCSDADPGL